MNLFCLFVYLCLSSTFASVQQSDDVILPPLQSGTLESAILLFPVEGVSGQSYVNLAKSIQLQLYEAYSLSFWVAIPNTVSWLTKRSEPEWQKVKEAADRVKGKLFDAGYMGSRLYYAAHSRSGALLQEYLIQDSTVTPAGMILLGSFLSRANQKPNASLPPTLVLSGSLDGVARVTRLAENFYHLYLNQNSKLRNQNRSVIIIEGMSHCQYFDGPAPALLQQNDLKAEINTTSARDEVSKTISDWIVSLTEQKLKMKFVSAMKQTKRRVQSTKEFLAPLISSLQMEGFYFFEPPCYQSNDTNCTNGSLWTPMAQAFMGGSLHVNDMFRNGSKVAANVISDQSIIDQKKLLQKLPIEFKIEDEDLLWPVDRVFPRDYIPKVYNKCSSPSSSCVLKSMTITELRYTDPDQYDMGLTPSSAYEMACKLSSRQRIFAAAGMGSYSMNQTDDLPLCSLINSAALEFGMKLVSTEALQRYNKYGKQMKIGTDYPTVFYPFWSPWHLCFEQMSNGKTPSCPMPVPFVHNSQNLKTSSSASVSGDQDYLLVEAPSMRFSDKLPIIGGLHFCKLLSPARVVEWIYVDSLRQNS